MNLKSLIDQTPITNISWRTCYRIIPSRFPPIDLFERVASIEAFQALYEIEQLTNPRLQDEIGDITLVEKNERIFGEGTSLIMAAFTHLSPFGTRFSDGSYGVYYAGESLETAIHETKYHREKFLKQFKAPPLEVDMRVLLANVKAPLHDISGKKQIFNQLHHPDDYSDSRKFGRALRGDGKASWGILYDSVRHEKGKCVAIFRPRSLTSCRQERHLCYVWNGDKISSVYKKEIVYA